MANKEVRVLVGTRKGGFLFLSDLRRKNWKMEGPFFPGGEVTHLMASVNGLGACAAFNRQSASVPDASQNLAAGASILYWRWGPTPTAN